MIILNLIWPAIYISQTFYEFWFLVIMTIIIETFAVKYYLKYTWKKSALVSLIGNIISGIIGTFLMKWGILLWHLVADMLLGGTFSFVNWIATFTLMCLGSVLLECIAIKIIFKETIKRLFFPLLLGNLLTYIIIAVFMSVSAYNESRKGLIENIIYEPLEKEFVINDTSTLTLSNATVWEQDTTGGIYYSQPEKYRIEIQYDKKGIKNSQFRLKSTNGRAIHGHTPTIMLDYLPDTLMIFIKERDINSFDAKDDFIGETIDSVKFVKVIKPD